jgi:hypothetical protein
MLADDGSDWSVRTDTRKYCLVNADPLCSSWYDGCTVTDSIIAMKLEHKDIDTMNVPIAEPETSEDDDNNGDLLIKNFWT